MTFSEAWDVLDTFYSRYPAYWVKPVAETRRFVAGLPDAQRRPVQEAAQIIGAGASDSEAAWAVLSACEECGGAAEYLCVCDRLLCAGCFGGHQQAGHSYLPG